MRWNFYRSGLEAKVDRLTLQLERAMATLQDVLDVTTQTQGDVASMQTFIQGIEQQLANALSGATLPSSVQAAVDQVFALAKANDAAIVAAIQSPPQASPPVVTQPSTTTATAASS